MIDLKTKVHDRYSIEFKMGLVTADQPDGGDFSVGMWLFVPNSLGITPSTYTKDDFYRSVKSNVRLITPHYSLKELASPDALPFKNAREAAKEDYEHNLKWLCAIAKSSMRDTSGDILAMPEGGARNAACDEFAASCTAILYSFDTLPHDSCHNWCGEFLCNCICRFASRILHANEDNAALKELLWRVDGYRSAHGYACVTINDAAANRDFIHRNGVLKKYVESMLYLRAPRKRDGVFVEQASFSIAAGMAMLFATVVAWAFQRHFGNLTWPLFIALIISYMMKDRIKELMRYWFAHRVGNRYFDKKAHIDYRSHRIGSLKEAVDFILPSKVPAEIEKVRNSAHIFDAEKRFVDESVIFYRKRVHLNVSALEKSSIYRFNGINDIIRLQMGPFMRNMDNAETSVSLLDSDGRLVDIPCSKDYFFNIIFEYHYGSRTEWRRYRVTANQDGVKSVDELL